MTGPPGSIVVLNGAPRSGKSSIARAVQDTFEGIWVNLGVDVATRRLTPPRYQPGIGLRPGADRPDVEALVPVLYAALFDSIAAHSRHGINVVVDVGLHDGYTRPLGVTTGVAVRLAGLPALLVGVRCPVEVVLDRRRAEPEDGIYTASSEIARRWEDAVHDPGLYDLEVDTSRRSPEECAGAIRERMEQGPPASALARLRSRSP